MNTPAVIDAIEGKLDKAGGTMTGALVLAGAPTENLHPATKQYVDEAAGAAFVGFSAYKGSNQTAIPTVTDTKLTFTTEEYDVGGYYDAANSRFTPPAGKYSIKAAWMCSGGAADQSALRILIYKNGAAYKTEYRNFSGTGTQGVFIACDIDLDGDDYVEVYAHAGGAGDKTAGAGATNTFFQAHKIG